MPRYHMHAYWEERYTREPGLYDWYQTYTRLSPLLGKYVQAKHKVLQIGTGTSPLAQEMVQMNGYKSIHNIDYSQIVVNQMRGLHRAIEGLSYALGDARNMPELPVLTFDCVFDKGTLDANMSGEDGVANGQSIVLECFRVTKAGGHFIVISHACPEARLPVLGQRWRQIEVFCISKPSLQGMSAIDITTKEDAEIRGPFLATDTDMMASLNSLEAVHFAYVCKR